MAERNHVEKARFCGVCAVADIREQDARCHGPEVGEHADEVVFRVAEHAWRDEVRGRKQHLKRATRAVAKHFDRRMHVAQDMAMVWSEAKRAAMVVECRRDLIKKRGKSLLASTHPSPRFVAERVILCKRAAPRHDA